MSDQPAVAKDQVVSIDYTLTDENGEEMDSSKGGEPLVYLHGHGNIVPGLEKALDGKKVGDSVKLTVAPEDGYGERDEERIFEVPRGRFEFEVKKGDVVRVHTPEGISQPLQVTDATDEVVTLDGNHPLAGKTLNFDVIVKAVREATTEEVEHGHIHEGGHDHDHDHDHDQAN